MDADQRKYAVDQCWKALTEYHNQLRLKYTAPHTVLDQQIPATKKYILEVIERIVFCDETHSARAIVARYRTAVAELTEEFINNG